MKTFVLLLALSLFTLACTQSGESQLTKEQAIQEIYNIEQAFNEMVAEQGRARAFAYFAAPNGGIQRSGRMIIGKDSIYAFYQLKTNTNVTLTWKPDRVEVSDDFTMAYTWGRAKFSGTRENGEDYEGEGLFHTVWKRQPDGSWRYVYD